MEATQQPTPEAEQSLPKAVPASRGAEAPSVRGGVARHARAPSQKVDQADWRSSLTKATGSYIYMAPEVLLGRAYDGRVDVYSFGVLAFELLTR